MFRFEDYKPLESVCTPIDKVGTIIDGYDSQDFNLNDAGWIRNDISQLARAQSKAEYDMILSRLQVLKESKGIPDDVTVEDAFKSIRPKWCQSPNELEWFAQFTNADVMSNIDDSYKAALTDTKVESGSSSDGAGAPAAE